MMKKAGMKMIALVLPLLVVSFLADHNVSYCMADDEPRDMGIVLVDETVYTIMGDGDAEMYVHRKIKVFNEGGKRYCAVGIVESDFEQIKDFKGYVMSIDGDTIDSLEKDDGSRSCGFSGYALYQDICHYVFNLVSSSYPFVAEYEYTVERKSLFFWPDWIPQNAIPVDSSSYILIAPSDFDFEYYSKGSMPDPMVDKSGGKIKYAWYLTKIPAFEKEECLADSYPYLYSIVFVPSRFKLGKYKFDGDSWQSLGREYNKMTGECFAMDDRQRGIMDSLAKVAQEPGDLACRLHEIMAQKMRYVAIEIGIGGWKPSVSKETFLRGYGDCKDLSTMYVSMLRHAGLDANLAIVRTRMGGLIDPQYPVLNRFNHVILYMVNGADTLWLDPTCQNCAAGDLPWSDENIHVLAVDDSGGHVVRTKPSSPDDNIIIRRAEIEIGAKKSIDINIKCLLKGNPAHTIRTLLEAGEVDRIRQIIKNEPLNLADKLSIDTIIYPGNIGSTYSFDMEIQGKVRNALHSVDERVYLDLTFLGIETECEKTDLSDRSYPLQMYYPFTYNDTLVFHVPEGYRIADIPQDINLQSEFGSLAVNYEVKDNRIVISRVKKYSRYSIGLDEFPTCKKYLQELNNIEKCFLVLEKM